MFCFPLGTTRSTQHTDQRLFTRMACRLSRLGLSAFSAALFGTVCFVASVSGQQDLPDNELRSSGAADVTHELEAFPEDAQSDGDSFAGLYEPPSLPALAGKLAGSTGLVLLIAIAGLLSYRKFKRERTGPAGWGSNPAEESGAVLTTVRLSGQRAIEIVEAGPVLLAIVSDAGGIRHACQIQLPSVEPVASAQPAFRDYMASGQGLGTRRSAPRSTPFDDWHRSPDVPASSHAPPASQFVSEARSADGRRRWPRN